MSLKCAAGSIGQNSELELTNSITINPFDRVFVTATESTKIHENIVRVGLAYRFGFGGY